MKNLVGRANWDHQNADKGGSAPDPWKCSISALIQRVEEKVDFLISCMGFQFPPSSMPGASKPKFPGSSEGGGKELIYILL